MCLQSAVDLVFRRPDDFAQSSHFAFCDDFADWLKLGGWLVDNAIKPLVRQTQIIGGRIAGNTLIATAYGKIRLASADFLVSCLL